MKFNNLVNDVINKEELALVYGGTTENYLDRACGSQACSKDIAIVKDLCNGDVICTVHAA